jgi:DMSO/TMAO reductase YedYZ molybdopterin-dependent catalytic subunit
MLLGYNAVMTRRELIAQAARAAAAGAAMTTVPAWARQAPASMPSDPWGKARLTRLSARPPDYETPVALLNDFITPVEHFYVRSHLPVPASIDAASWTLAVSGLVSTPQSLSVADLRALPQHTVTVTLECAGNGRAFFDPPVAGLQWKKGAVGTARWTGVRLRDVLSRVGASAQASFVRMEGADRPLGTMPAFVRQVPMAKAMHEDTLIALSMNGQPIPAVHGAPLRAIIPGWEGAYSLKWLNRLEVAEATSDSFWVATAYKYPTRRVSPGEAVDAKDMAPLTGLVVKSLITAPLDGATMPSAPFTVSGFAWAGEDDIAHVDVSLDSGATWARATLTGEQARYTWRRFEFAAPGLPVGSHLILSRATDSRGVTQPAVSHWNPSGYLWNQYDSVRVQVGASR